MALLNSKIDWKQIGAIFASYRKIRNLSQKEVADVIDKQRASIANFESGRQRVPLQVLEDMANVLGLSCELFIAEGKALNGYALIDPVSKMPVMVSATIEEIEKEAIQSQIAKDLTDLNAKGYRITPIMWGLGEDTSKPSVAMAQAS
ncbi:helix-turn-helix domain-containing protein [Pseudomonas luteola]